MPRSRWASSITLRMDDRRVERFWSAIQRGSKDSCWIWQQSKTRTGYGVVNFKGTRTTAHRIAYELEKGQIPDGHYVLHRCDNPSCCNPEHLFTGTQKENIADMHNKGRAGDCRNFGEKHGRVKLSDAEVRTLIQDREGGATQQSLAIQYGISQAQVGRIVRGENRVHH